MDNNFDFAREDRLAAMVERALKNTPDLPRLEKFVDNPDVYYFPEFEEIVANTMGIPADDLNGGVFLGKANDLPDGWEWMSYDPQTNTFIDQHPQAIDYSGFLDTGQTDDMDWLFGQCSPFHGMEDAFKKTQEYDQTDAFVARDYIVWFVENDVMSVFPPDKVAVQAMWMLEEALADGDMSLDFLFGVIPQAGVLFDLLHEGAKNYLRQKYGGDG